MASAAFVKALSVQFDVTYCIKCSAPVALSSEFIANCKRLGGGFWCPYCGKEQGWYKNTESDKLKRQLQVAQENAEWYQRRARKAEEETASERRSKIAYKGQLTKVKRKVANGSCPCCMRHFTDLQRHMQTKHPEYVAESNEEASP